MHSLGVLIIWRYSKHSGLYIVFIGELLTGNPQKSRMTGCGRSLYPQVSVRNLQVWLALSSNY